MASSGSSVRQRLVTASRSVLSVFSIEGDEANKRAFSTPQQPNGTMSRSLRSAIMLFYLAIALAFISNLVGQYSTPRQSSNSDGHSRLAQYPDMRVDDTPEFKELTATEKALAKERAAEEAIAITNRTFSKNAPSEGETVARLIVLTMDRAVPLKRLLMSAEAADYGDERVDIDIWIDRENGKAIDFNVLKVAEQFIWSHGAKTIHLRRKNGGLYQQWIYTWKITDQTDEIAVILEDDLELSPMFYQWLKSARNTYNADPEIGAFTLQRSTLRPKLPPGGKSHVLDLGNDVHVFKYRLLGSWGFSPVRERWVEFRTWYEKKRRQGEKPYVDGLITTRWYKQQEVKGHAPSMWTQWWIRFVHEKGYFTVTPRLADGTTLCANWRERGMHYVSGRQGKDFPIFRGTSDQFTWPVNPLKIDWDGSIIDQ